MKKSLFHRWFGLGKIPARLRPILEAEGVLLAEEGISGSITMKNFRAPGRISIWRKKHFAGALVLTRKRFVATAFSATVVEIPLPNTLGAKIQLALDERDCLCLNFEAADFRKDHAGTVTLRYKTAQARRFLEALTSS